MKKKEKMESDLEIPCSCLISPKNIYFYLIILIHYYFLSQFALCPAALPVNNKTTMYIMFRN